MQEVISLINTNRGNGRKENLNRMRLLMEKIGDPQKELKFIHLAGTNGKGSTAAFVDSILKKSGLNTGLFTSPHLQRINERLQINGAEITDEEFIQTTQLVEPYVGQVEEELGEKLYAFEILTAVAFLYFKEKEVDIVILETGVGGRLDATNVITQSEVSVITSIGMDHMKVLGNTIEEIAKEKAGIIKKSGTIVTYPFSKSIQTIVEEIAWEKETKWIPVDPAQLTILSSSIDGQRFTYKGTDEWAIQMLGIHQVYNAVTALEAMWVLQDKGWPVTIDSIREGLATAFWPGRLEKVCEEPLVLLDGAHNLQGVEMLRENADVLFPDQVLHFLIGTMEDKEYEKMIALMEGKAKSLLFLAPKSERAFDAEAVERLVEKEGIKSRFFKTPAEGAQYIRTQIPKDEVCMVFGSLYLVGDMRSEFLK
ncbi:bifunctional folylpolyglutamate synthase/dihydrofolate synthase [Lacticigenium naphthae]|uniref:bifunctional folylpolyglutamate synthase/dihydrofolate synthase n=1 Tax=Lacticigenium naphthae TaxID=515351 RepID=UPI001FE1DBC8|nr:folylpolyglutamate synthase/dihydrofolate synthase family protein [Lacticigenium naphthae]